MYSECASDSRKPSSQLKIPNVSKSSRSGWELRQEQSGVWRQAFHTTSKPGEILHFHPHGQQAYTEIMELYFTVDSLLNQESLGEGWWFQTTHIRERCCLDPSTQRKQFLIYLFYSCALSNVTPGLSRMKIHELKIFSIHPYPTHYHF